MAGDVVDYSRMMAEDEAGTYRELRATFDDIITPKVASHGGRVFKENGDGYLAVFASIHDALDAAVEIQQALSERRFRLRIGLNLGDVIEDANDIYGDGVNVAARLEAMAAPGSIYVSEPVQLSVEKTAGRSFRRIGRRAAKNMPGGLEVFELLIGPAAGRRHLPWRAHLSARRALMAGAGVLVVLAASAAATGHLGMVPRWIAGLPLMSSSGIASRPSVAVMPFNNLSGDVTQAYFSDGLTEDLITELSRNPDLAVVARSSTFALRGEATDVRRIGRRLGARYVVEGGVRRDGDQLRVAAQLVDAETGTHLWARNYDRRMEDVFAVQAELSAEIVASLVSYVRRSEIASAKQRPTEDLRAYDLVLRARDLHPHASSDAQTFREARGLLRQAIALDPNYAEAYAYLGLSLIQDKAGAVTGEATDQDLAAGIEAARQAIRLQPDLALGYRVLSFGLSVSSDHAGGLQAAESAVALNPNDPDSLAVLAKAQLRFGAYDEALKNARRARALHPMAPNYYAFVEGQALYAANRLDEAAEAIRQCLIGTDQRANCLRIAAAVEARRGRLDEARTAMAQLVAMEPEFTLAKEEQAQRYGSMPVMRQYMADLAAARQPRSAEIDAPARRDTTAM